jgi:NAD(P)-dependent dehydrogenase (short-subunit alcohol dehydrogenase family)
MGLYCVTGGASGIGAGIVDRLRQGGNEVFIVDIQNADIVADLSSEQGREEAADGIREKAPDGLDGFVPCAGIGPGVEPVSKITRINYFGAVNLTSSIKDLVAKRRGAIVMISSNSSRMAPCPPEYLEALLAGDETAACEFIDTKDGQTAYAGGKFAVSVWMRRNTQPWLAEGVRLNAVAPGFVSTALTAKGLNDPIYGPLMAEFVKSIPVGREGIPADIAEAVAFLLSDKATFIAGSVVYVDGGHDALLRPDSY